MPLFSEQDNPASFSPYILTRSVHAPSVNFIWYLVLLDIFITMNHLYKITGLMHCKCIRVHIFWVAFKTSITEHSTEMCAEIG